MFKGALEKKKGDAHETLYLFVNRDGVLPNMVMDKSKDQTLGFFRKKSQEAYYHINQIEPYYPWQLQAKRNIMNLEKGSGRKIVRAGAPKKIWDDALEFEAYMRSHISLDVDILQREVSETVMLGLTSDISQFCEHGFYDWVMFRNEPIQYPDENMVLGMY